MNVVKRNMVRLQIEVKRKRCGRRMSYNIEGALVVKRGEIGLTNLLVFISVIDS